MSELKITEIPCGAATVLVLVGKTTIGDGSVKLRNEIRRIIQEGAGKEGGITTVVLHMPAMTYTDSSGVGELVTSFTCLNKEGATLVLSGLSQKMTDLLAITKLLSCFDTYETATEAVTECGGRLPTHIPLEDQIATVIERGRQLSEAAQREADRVARQQERGRGQDYGLY